MKAKFYSIDENGDQILNHTTSDFEITENGNPVEVLTVSCPVPKAEPVSFVIAVDVSGSMRGEEIVTLKNSLNYFIDLVPNDGSEVAIIAFNSGNHFISDFTRDKSKLKSKISALSAGGGTSFDAAFTNHVAGALIAIEKAKHQNRNVIIITDGKANGDEKFIANKAKSLGTRVFGMLINNKATNILKNIFNLTGGERFENIITEDDYKNSFQNIKQIAGNNLCEIQWESKFICEEFKRIEILNISTQLTKKINHFLLRQQTAQIDIEPNIVNLGALKKGNEETFSIRLTANKIDQTVSSVTYEPNINNIKLFQKLPIIIRKGKTRELKFEYKTIDTNRHYTKININSDLCESNFGILSGSNNQKILSKTVELLRPNGQEIFIAGLDTIINWKGIPEDDRVRLEFSSNGGNDWTIISNSTSSLKYTWELPNISSDNCLISIHHYIDSSVNKSVKPKIEWSKTLGGSNFETSSGLIHTNDNGFLLIGNTRSENGDLKELENKGELDNWVIKLDEYGDIEWNKIYGGSKTDAINTVIQTSDGKFLLAGFSFSNNGDLESLGNKGMGDVWLIMLNSDGTLEWSKTYGGNKHDEAISVIQTKDNGFLMVCNTESSDSDLEGTGIKRYDDIWLIKLDNNGELEWSKTYGGSGYDIAVSLISTEDNGFVISGFSNSNDEEFIGNNGHDDLFILKINETGDIIWFRFYGGSKRDNANSVIKTYDGGFLVTGHSSSTDGDLESIRYYGNYDAWIIKLDKNGNIEWSDRFGGSEYDHINSINQNYDGSFIASGYSSSSDNDLNNKNIGGYDAWLLKLTNNGKLEMSESLGGSDDDLFFNITETIDDGFVVSGRSQSKDSNLSVNKGEDDIWIIKFFINQTTLQSDTSDAVFSIIMPEPVIQNNDIDMGEMIVGNTKDTIVSSVICNTGDAPLHVLGVDITGGDDIDFLIPRGAGDFYLEKDQCQDMMFEFTPSALGNRTAVATIRTTIGDFNDTINIRGLGINPLIEATTDVVDFGQFELGEGKDTNVVLIKNVGTEDITITETKITGPDTEQFDMVPLPSFTLTSGDDKELELNYTAKYGGRTSSIIEFHYDGVGSPLRSMLFAEGIGGEVYPQVPDAYVGDRVELGLHLGRIKPEGLNEVATNFSATVSYNSTLLAPIDKNMTVTTENTTSFIEIEGQLSGVSQIATVPMKVGLGTAVKSGLVVTEFQLYDANGDSVYYEIEPGVGEFNVLGICEEGGTRLVNPNGEKVGLRVAQNRLNTSATIYLDLIESGQTDLIIYDQLGNAIETAYSGTPSTGSKELSLDLGSYTNGRYYIKLTTPTITKTEIIEVVR
jgi:uncharacterized protein YegL